MDDGAGSRWIALPEAQVEKLFGLQLSDIAAMAINDPTDYSNFLDRLRSKRCAVEVVVEHGRSFVEFSLRASSTIRAPTWAPLTRCRRHYHRPVSTIGRGGLPARPQVSSRTLSPLSNLYPFATEPT